MTNLMIVLVLAWNATGGIKPEEQAIRAVLEMQQRDWNSGKIEAFMEGYEKSDSLVFTSRGLIFRGWRDTLERYLKNYPDRGAMGQLEFSDLEITLLGDSAALALGKWALTLKSDRPHGIFTLVLRKQAGLWRIIHDHTSQSP